MIRRLLITLTACLPLLAQASGGAWSQSTGGGVISVGSQIMTGPALAPPSPVPASARITRINWRITLLAPPPAGLEIKLCTQAKCILLNGLSGQRVVPASMRPGDAWRFIYNVKQRGQLRPALNIVSQQLTVNYR